MADGHWLDPLARSLLEASGQLPARPKPAAAAGKKGPRTDHSGSPGQDDPATSAQLSSDPSGNPEPPPLTRSCLPSSCAHNPGLRLTTAAEVRHAAALGWRLDVNRATAADWLRLPGIGPHQVDLLLRLQAGGVQLSGPEDLEQLLELPGGPGPLLGTPAAVPLVWGAGHRPGPPARPQSGQR